MVTDIPDGRAALARGSVSVDRLQPHLAHQALHPLAVDPVALPAQPARHLPAAEERIRKVRFVDHPHQTQVFIGLGLRPMVVGRAYPDSFHASPSYGA
jgi:hypothetical protein